MLDRYRKDNPATIKKLPVQSDVPKLLVLMAYNGSGMDKDNAVADLTMIAFYYLLRVGECTVKRTQNSTKQTMQFKYEDVTFFCKNNRGQLWCLPQNAPEDLIATADGATLKLDNPKNGWKGVCTTRQMATTSTARYKHWVTGTSTHDIMELQQKISCLCTSRN
jgi:hypothetical protein